MINQKLQDFEEDVKPLGDLMTQVTCKDFQLDYFNHLRNVPLCYGQANSGFVM